MIGLFVLAQAADSGGLDEVLQLLTDGAHSGDLVLLIAGAVGVAGLVTLKLLGKNIPLVGPLVKVVVGVLRKVRPAKPPQSSVDESGVAGVIPVKLDKENQK